MLKYFGTSGQNLEVQRFLAGQSRYGTNEVDGASTIYRAEVPTRFRQIGQLIKTPPLEIIRKGTPCSILEINNDSGKARFILFQFFKCINLVPASYIQ